MTTNFRVVAKRRITMAERTFGWVQEAYKLSNLKNVVSLFVPDSHINQVLCLDKIPRLISEEYGKSTFIAELEKEQIEIPYMHLKGKGTPPGYTRSSAPCTGIVQAVLPGQRKEYQSDWPADSYIRWAISIGFLQYNRRKDTCFISESGREFAAAEAGSEEERNAITKAFLSYPPICRILALLDKKGHMTKFEIGSQLGFIGEAGFTSIPQHMMIQGLSEANTPAERAKLLQDTEGTSDKYVRTICSWLKQLRWIVQIDKQVTATIGTNTYTDTIAQAYQLTLAGKKVLKYSAGNSKFEKIPKRVLWDMLATKVTDRDYLRNRRSYIIKYMEKSYRSLSEIAAYLKTKEIEEAQEVIKDDISSFENIGLTICRQGKAYKITDDIIDLEIPAGKESNTLTKSDTARIKDKLRTCLSYIDHKYLLLVDLGFEGKADRDYEVQTAELLTSELAFKGARLGDSRKPDVCVFYGKKGLIIDNKAYGKGYSLPIKQADEMYRYIEENKIRDKKLNPNEWWKVFDKTVTEFVFAFVSGKFTGGYQERIRNLSLRSEINGAVINSVNLLLMAEEIKAGRLSYQEALNLFETNAEICFL